MKTECNELIPRTALPQMVLIYREAEAEIRDCFGKIEAATNRLNAAFQAKYGFAVAGYMKDLHIGFDEPDAVIERMKRHAWRVLCERMEIRRVLSQTRSNSLDKQLETGKDENGAPLPEITEANILAMMESNLTQVGMYIEEMVKEVYNWLIPGMRNEYVTNKRTLVGRKVIKEYSVERGYGQAPFRVNYHREASLRSLDNVFHALDGKGSIKTHRGPLVEAICNSPDGTGETDYFRFKCFKNGNLHLEFKRQDLLDQFNAVAGGMRLHNGERKEAA